MSEQTIYTDDSALTLIDEPDQATLEIRIAGDLDTRFGTYPVELTTRLTSDQAQSVAEILRRFLARQPAS